MQPLPDFRVGPRVAEGLVRAVRSLVGSMARREFAVRPLGVLAVFAIALGLTGLSGSANGSAASGAVGAAGHATEEAPTGDLALTVLDSIRVEKEWRGGYSRALFPTWLDLDGDGCNAREEVLIAKSYVDVATTDSCRVVSGRWYSSYDGQTVYQSSDVDIDHLVSVKEVWDSGGYAWSDSRREAFANDTSDNRTLHVSSVSANRSKGDRDPSNWLPVDSAICEYLVDWIAVKKIWGLSMDPSEVGRIRKLLKTKCTDHRIDLTKRPVPAPNRSLVKVSPSTRLTSVPSTKRLPTVSPRPSSPVSTRLSSPVSTQPRSVSTQPGSVATKSTVSRPKVTVPSSSRSGVVSTVAVLGLPNRVVGTPVVGESATTTEPLEAAGRAAGYYKNCAEAREAGVAPLRLGQPGYRVGLDRNRDGVACEAP